jgi:hypothetical protein
MKTAPAMAGKPMTREARSPFVSSSQNATKPDRSSVVAVFIEPLMPVSSGSSANLVRAFQQIAFFLSHGCHDLQRVCKACVFRYFLWVFERNKKSNCCHI